MTDYLLNDGHDAELERLREYEADYTPGPVVRQGLEWALQRVGMPLRFLDPSAGAGVFGQQLSALGHDGLRWAIEPRREERGLGRHYQVVTISRFEETDFDDPFGLIATNPPFSMWPTFLTCALDLVEEGGAVLFYGSIAWGQSGAGAPIFATHPPIRCARVVGRVIHRGPGLNPKTNKPWASDQRDTCWWLWVKGHHPRGWTTENLPALPKEARRWTVKPGTEPETMT